MSAHTPTSTPWQVKHDFDVEGRTTIIGNVDGEIIDGTTRHSYDFVCRTLDEDDDSQSRSIAVANAELIVRAVNSHEAMKDELNDTLSFVNDAISWCADSELGPLIERRERLEALIAKARGETL